MLQNLWKTACDPKYNGGLDIPSVKQLFTAPKMDLHLFHGGGVVDTDIMPLSAHVVLLGATGMGKSNASGLILEQIHSATDPGTGGCAIPIFIADFQGEHASIFEIYPENVFYVKEILEREWEEEVKKNVYETKYSTFGKRDAENFVKGRTTHHFDMTPFIMKMPLVKQYLHEFLVHCYALKTQEYEELKKIGKKPRAHLFYFSEAHNFFPEIMPSQERDDEFSKALRDDGIAMVRGGRKIGVHCGFDSQRPSQLDKDISSQSLNRFLLPVIDRPDMEYYMALLPKVRWGDLNTMMADMRQPKNIGQVFVRLRTTGAGLMIRRFLKKKSRDMGGTPDLASSINWEYGGNEAQEAWVPEPRVSENPYEILQADKMMSNQELKACYRRQLRAWHPDHHQNDEEGVEYSEEMSKKINAAWDSIRRERNIN